MVESRFSCGSSIGSSIDMPGGRPKKKSKSTDAAHTARRKRPCMQAADAATADETIDETSIDGGVDRGGVGQLRTSSSRNALRLLTLAVALALLPCFALCSSPRRHRASLELESHDGRATLAPQKSRDSGKPRRGATRRAVLYITEQLN